MKIELNYDPVKPETMVRIDQKMIDKSDIYGFLYPVRHCLLQTWLYPSGSWSGLERQLRELSRGEEIELVFFGRSEDFEDIQAALKNMDKLTLQLQHAEPTEKYHSLFEQLDSQLALLLDAHTESSEKKTLAEIFPETAKAAHSVQEKPLRSWMCIIETDDDFLQADQQELCCCIVHEMYLDSFEKIDKLNTLTRSMRRSQDMISCCFDNPEKKVDFAHYAAQYENLKIRFSEEKDCVPLLRRKYGSTYDLRWKFLQYQQIVGIMNQCFEQREFIESRRTSLSKEKNRTYVQTRELEKSKIILNWFQRKAPYLAELNRLLTSGTWEENQEKE